MKPEGSDQAEAKSGFTSADHDDPVSGDDAAANDGVTNELLSLVVFPAETVVQNRSEGAKEGTAWASAVAGGEEVPPMLCGRKLA